MATEHDRPEYREGEDAAHAFKRTLGRILTVSKEELTRREIAYKKSRKRNRRRK